MARGGKKGFTGGQGVLWLLLLFGLLVPHWQALAWIGGIGLLIGWLTRNKASSAEAPPAELPAETVLPAASRTLSSPSVSRPPAAPVARAMSRADGDTLTVTVTIGAGPAASGYRIPPAPMSAPAVGLSHDGARFWKPVGETAFVKGQRLDGGLLLLWRGDALLDTLRLMLRRRGIRAENHGIGLRIEASEATARAALLDVVAAGETTPQALLDGIGNLAAGKWDWAVPLALRQRDFAGQRLEADAAVAMVAALID